MGHIHKQGSQKDSLTKKELQRTILDFYYIYYKGLVYDYK
jgi:hypothetical protein